MLFTPDWFDYFLKYFVKSRLLGQRNPILAGFKITHQCNLACRHCPFWPHREDKTLTFAQISDIMHKIYQSGIRILIFEGGEPLLWRDDGYAVHQLIAEARKLFFSVGLTTNGTFPIDVPAHTVWVSLDRLAETHNHIRGKPIFDRVIENIRNSPHPNIYANITINRLNVREIPELVKFLKGLVKGITIQFHYPYAGLEDLMPDPDQRRWILDELIRLKQAGYPVADSVAALEALKENRWRCHDWMLADVEPDGQVNLGCYVKNRGKIMCQHCGFAAHTEISLAYDLNIEAIRVGQKIFRYGLHN